MMESNLEATKRNASSIIKDKNQTIYKSEEERKMMESTLRQNKSQIVKSSRRSTPRTAEAKSQPQSPDDSNRAQKEKSKDKPASDKDDVEEEVSSAANTWVFICIFLMTVSFIVICFCEINTESIYFTQKSIENCYKTVDFTSNKITFTDITTLEEVEKYLKAALFTVALNEELSISYPSAIPTDEPLRQHFVNQFNLLCGLRLTFKCGNLVENNNDISSNLEMKIRDEDYTSSTATYDSEKTDSLFSLNYAKEYSFAGSGGYTIFIEGNSSLTEGKKKLEPYLNGFIVNKTTISVTLEYLYFNGDHQVLFYNAYSFIVLNSGFVKVKEYPRGALPQIYDSYKKESSTMVKIFFQILFQVLAAINLFTVVMYFIRLLFAFCNKQDIYFSTSEIYNIITVVFIWISIFFWYWVVFNYRDTFRLPMKESDFQKWIDYTSNFDTHTTVASITLILLFIRLILELNRFFPNFGILFYTITKGSYDLITLFTIGIILMLGYAFATYFSLGYLTDNYSGVGSSLLNLFFFGLGEVSYDSLSVQGDAIGCIIFFSFTLLFYFSIFIMFLSILIYHYQNIRNKLQIRIEANTLIAEEDTKKWTKNFLNLIFCRLPEGSSNAEDSGDAGEAPDVDDILSKKKDQKEQSHISLCSIFWMNFNILFKPNEYTIQQRQIRIENTIKYIGANRNQELEKKEKERQSNVIYNICDGLLFLVFMILLLIVLIFHLNVSSTLQAKKSIWDLLDTQGVTRTNYLNGVVNNVEIFLNMFYEKSTDNTLPNKQKFFTNPLIRATLNYDLLYSNPDSKTKAHYINRRCDENGVIRKVNSPQLLSLTPTNISQNDYLFKFYTEGSTETYKEKGGIVFYFYLNSAKGRDLFKYLPNIFGVKLSESDFELLFYAPNSRFFVYGCFKTTYTNYGIVKTSFVSTPYQRSSYIGNSKYRTILEILIFLFLWYYSIIEFRFIAEFWEKQRQIDNADSPPSKTKTKLEATFIFLYIDPRKEKEAPSIILVFIILGVFKFLYILIRRFLIILFQYIFYSFSHLLQIAVIILKYIMLVYWYLFSTLDLKVEIKKQEDTGYEDIFGEMSEKAKYLENYRIVCSFCIFCVVLELIPRLEFVNVIHRMLNVLSRAQTSLIFFLFLDFLLLVGFAFTAYFLFGTTEEDFHTYERSFLSCFLMMVGRSRYSQMSGANNYISPIFYIIFMFVFYYFFFYMFITIVCVYYVETEKEKKQNKIEEIGILDQISTELDEKFDKIPLEQKREEIMKMSQEEIDEVISQRASKIPFLYRMFAFCTCKKFRLKELLNQDKKEQMSKSITGNDNEEEGNIVKASNGQNIEDISPILDAFIKDAKKQIKDSEEPQDIDLLQPAEWIEAFKNSLFDLSGSKLKMSDLLPKSHTAFTEIQFYPKSIRSELDEKIIEFLNLENQRSIQEDYWNQANIELKYKYWQGIEIYNAENYFGIHDFLSIIKSKPQKIKSVKTNG